MSRRIQTFWLESLSFSLSSSLSPLPLFFLILFDNTPKAPPKFHLFLSKLGSAQFAKVIVKWVYGMEFSYACSRTDFLTTFPELFSWMNFEEQDFKFCFTWYPTAITLCLWSRFIYPRIRTFDNKPFHGLFSKQKPLKSRPWKIVPELNPHNQTYSRFWVTFSLLFLRKFHSWMYGMHLFMTWFVW